VQSNNYWSATTNTNNTDNAWNVNMNNGNVNNNNKSNNNYVWPVRGDNDALHLFSYENIYRQYLKCRRHKRGTINALKYEVNCEENLTSQFFANVYLNQLDQFVKHQLKRRYYIRYCDDFVMLSDDRDMLLKWKAEIEKFLRDKLKLRLNKRESFEPVSNGIDFLGYIARRNYILVRRRVVNNLKSRLAFYERQLIRNNPPYLKLIYDYQILEKLRATLASYFGHFKWANSYRLQMSLIEKSELLKRFFTFRGGRLKEDYRIPPNISSLRLQYRYFKTRFPKDVLLFQVGGYYQFYQDESETAHRLGLKRINRSKTRKVKYGFPITFAEAYIDRLKRYGKSVTVVGEEDRYLTRVKERLLRYRLVLQSFG